MHRLYARVSTIDKDQDPETQLHAMRTQANAGKEYVEHASARGARPVWSRLLREVEPGDTILCWKLDRAFRSVKDAANTLADLTARGISFRALTEGWDTSNASGRLMFNVLASVAEFERDILCERVKAGMARAKAQGKHVGRPWKSSAPTIA